jgi:hypothetical protein
MPAIRNLQPHHICKQSKYQILGHLITPLYGGSYAWIRARIILSHKIWTMTTVRITSEL